MKSELSKSDLNLTLDIIHKSVTCKTDEHFEELICRTNRLIEFTHIRSLLGDSNEYNDKKMAALKMITSFPEEWEKRYNENDYFLYDNIAATAYSSSGLIYWADYTEIKNAGKKRNEKSREIMAEAASVGLKEGWLFSMKGRRSSERAILSLAGEKSENCHRSRKILEYVSPHLCLAVKRIILEKDKSLPRLTSREIEVLSWTADGKTAWEISVILNISRRTVEFHMGNILHKLDAANSQNAIAIALSNGLIKY
jgi:DNA-binding CsgD family transcriptional regulator